MQPDRLAIFERLRPRLVGIAYRMLQTNAEAEDVVQDAWIRLDATSDVHSVEGFLVRTVTRLCLDREKSARARREEYIGPWLPEPMEVRDPAIEHEETLSLAALHVIGTLRPVERAVFLLREVFDYQYDEIGVIVDRTAAACRQIARRARERVQARGPDSAVPHGEHAALLEAFLSAAQLGDLSELEKLLAADAELIADGGGKVVAALKPILGAGAVARFMAGIARKAWPGISVVIEPVNGVPAAIVLERGAPVALFSLHIQDGRIRRVLALRNPDKLRATSWRQP